MALSLDHFDVLLRLVKSGGTLPTFVNILFKIGMHRGQIRGIICDIEFDYVGLRFLQRPVLLDIRPLDLVSWAFHIHVRHGQVNRNPRCVDGMLTTHRAEAGEITSGPVQL